MSISDEALDAALEKVSYMFPSHTNTHQDTLAQSQGPKFPAKGNGRTRVDSQARPPEFARNIKRDINRGDNRVDYHEFSLHGVHEPVLRQRFESKAIDPATMSRVLAEFQLHDKLSKEDLNKLRELTDEAQKLHKDNDDSGAEHIFEQVLETDPVNFESLITLGKLKYFKGELEKARDLFDRALVVRPELEKTMYRLGRVLYDMQQFDRSKLLLEQVVQGFQGEIMGDKCDQHTYHNAIAMLGLIHQKVLHDLTKAESLYKAVLDMDDKHLLALDHRSSLLVQLGRTDEAAALHRRVCALDPTHTKKSCPYLDGLFPSDSDALHDVRPMQRQIEDWSTKFGSGLPAKHWSNHPIRSLAKKLRRALGHK